MTVRLNLSTYNLVNGFFTAVNRTVKDSQLYSIKERHCKRHKKRGGGFRPLFDIASIDQLISINQLESQSGLITIRLARTDLEDRVIGPILPNLHTP